MSEFPDFDGTQHCSQPGVDPEIFHPRQGANGHTVEAAKGFCNGTDSTPPCPFRNGCREYGVTHSVHGLWGGWAEDERKADRKARRIVPEPLSFHAASGAEITTTVLRRHGSWAGIGQHARYKERDCEECREYRNGRRRRLAQEKGKAS